MSSDRSERAGTLDGTSRWAEVEAALRNMVDAARIFRERRGGSGS